MKKIFAYDLDGTLLTKENLIHPQTIEGLKLVKQKGHYNVIATGRGLANILPLFGKNDLSSIDYIICSNGAMIHNPKTKENQIIKAIDPKVMDVVYKVFLESESILLRVDTIYKNQTLIHDKYLTEWATKSHAMGDNYYKPSTKQEVWQNINNPQTIITQIALLNEQDKAKEITDQLVKELKPFGCEVYLTNLIYSDINGVNVSKLNGLKLLAKDLNINLKNLVAFGDSGNDVSMLKNAGYSIAMDNAADDAKAAAKAIIGNHNTGTIGEFIQSYLEKDL